MNSLFNSQVLYFPCQKFTLLKWTEIIHHKTHSQKRARPPNSSRAAVPQWAPAVGAGPEQKSRVSSPALGAAVPVARAAARIPAAGARAGPRRARGPSRAGRALRAALRALRWGWSPAAAGAAAPRRAGTAPGPAPRPPPAAAAPGSGGWTATPGCLAAGGGENRENYICKCTLEGKEIKQPSISVSFGQRVSHYWAVATAAKEQQRRRWNSSKLPSGLTAGENIHVQTSLFSLQIFCLLCYICLYLIVRIHWSKRKFRICVTNIFWVDSKTWVKTSNSS